MSGINDPYSRPVDGGPSADIPSGVHVRSEGKLTVATLESITRAAVDAALRDAARAVLDAGRACGQDTSGW
jgi:hypothetical protein